MVKLAAAINAAAIAVNGTVFRLATISAMPVPAITNTAGCENQRRTEETTPHIARLMQDQEWTIDAGSEVLRRAGFSPDRSGSSEYLRPRRLAREVAPCFS